MKEKVFSIIAVVGIMASSVVPVFAGESCGTDHCCCSPFGSYCTGAKCGWYGARTSVKTAVEAAQIIKTYFQADKVTVANIKEKELYFEAEVRDNGNALVDVVIVDKRTGRLRSIY